MSAPSYFHCRKVPIFYVHCRAAAAAVEMQEHSSFIKADATICKCFAGPLIMKFRGALRSSPTALGRCLRQSRIVSEFVPLNLSASDRRVLAPSALPGQLNWWKVAFSEISRNFVNSLPTRVIYFKRLVKSDLLKHSRHLHLSLSRF